MLRRALTVAVLLLPAVVWSAVHLHVAAHIDEWAAASEPLPLATRLGIVADNHAARALPFGALLLIAFAPLVTLGVAWSAGTFRLSGEDVCTTVLLRWWGASVALFAVFVALMVAQRPSLSMGLSWGFPAVHVALLWSAFVCCAVSLGATYALQRERHARAYSHLRPGWVFGIAAPLSWLGWPALFVPIGFWLAARRDGRAIAAPAAGR